MPKHFDHDLHNLEKRILSQASSVESLVYAVVRSLQERSASLAEKVMGGVTDITREEIEVENESLKILALHQPVATDLRRTIAAMKINTNLGRMADLAVNIAERVLALVKMPPLVVPAKLQRMTDQTVGMVRESLDSFVRLDQRKARNVIVLDDEVDRYNREIIEDLIRLMQEAPAVVPAATSLFSVVRNLERIADHAAHVAEDVIYLVEGDIVRNGPHLALSNAR
jgi:phosphate transport system protein